MISTSHVERANLSMRMGMRRFTRLTNAFSKKLENHMHAISFYFMVYNFVKIHKSWLVLGVTGAGGVVAHQLRAHQLLLPARQLLPGTD